MRMADSLKYSPRAAWGRALVYFTVCLALAETAGVLRDIGEIRFPRDADWIVATTLVTLYALFAYAYFWPLGTETHGRPRRVLAGTAFGVLWGVSQGALLLTVYGLLESIGWAPSLTVAAVFVTWSVLTAAWHSQYWDIYVSPKHNIESWNLRKVLVAHMPFLLLCLAHYAIWDHEYLVIAWHVIALTASALTMRFPSPRDPVVTTS